MHGLADTNVRPAHTPLLSEALLAAGRPHEVLLLPGTGHQPIGTDLTGDLLHHQARFLREHLGARPAGVSRAAPSV
ncbi:alpha/beta hydrolase family protein [Streptomyces sp. Ag109_G2-15]|uniref:alpha/beta hydrolase family protein n=1 Tax=Streptomyces sp. Ag109_G2-15 TaxID=1938850 RepID=UPI00359C231C